MLLEKTLRNAVSHAIAARVRCRVTEDAWISIRINVASATSYVVSRLISDSIKDTTWTSTTNTIWTAINKYTLDYDT